MVEMLVVRHAQSTWNAERRWSGQADPPLSASGRASAEELARQLAADGRYDGVVSSDLCRARETAEIIAAELGLAPPRTVQALRERHTGVWTAKTETEIEQEWPGWLERRRRGELTEIPEGEGQDDFDARVVAALVEVAATAAGGRLIVVGHSGTLRALERRCGITAERGNLQGVRLVVEGSSIRQVDPGAVDRREGGAPGSG